MYIANQLMKGNTALRDRLLRIGNALSSHSLFDPIFCQLTIHFVSDYLHRILLDPSALDQSVEMHTFLLLCLNSAFKGSNRLFMFDVNNHQSKFHHLYQPDSHWTPRSRRPRPRAWARRSGRRSSPI